MEIRQMRLEDIEQVTRLAEQLGYPNTCDKTLLSDPRAEITALVVDESKRGKNIGKLLLEHAEHWAKERSLNIVRLRSNVKRTDAHRFYLREGYEIQKSWHSFVKELK